MTIQYKILCLGFHFWNQLAETCRRLWGCCSKALSGLRHRSEHRNPQAYSQTRSGTQKGIKTPSPCEDGGIRWNCAWANVSITCAGEYVGLEEIDNGFWNVCFASLRLGRLSEQHSRIGDAYGSLWRHKKKNKV